MAISHPERIVDAKSGLTKLELAQYFDAVSKWMLALRARAAADAGALPGRNGRVVLLSEAPRPGMPPSIHESQPDGQPALDIEDAEGLIALAQFGSLELHGWGAPLANPSHPDWMVFDLDPDEALPFSRVIAAAREVRELLAASELESFVKTTGGKGLHEVVPLTPAADWEAVKRFTRAVAEALERRAPDRYTAKMSKSVRTGKIFVDHLRNARGSTAVLPYSPRARPGAPVAMPVAWRALDELDPSQFNVRTVPAYLARHEDPWATFHATQQRLPDAFSREK